MAADAIEKRESEGGVSQNDLGILTSNFVLTIV
jgi:hypothetical protein